MKNQIKKNSNFVILFDESLHEKLQSKQCDFHIRTWQNTNEVHTRYLTSLFMGHGTAVHLKDALTEVLSTVGINKLIQISMDGPNVNWRMYEDFSSEFKTDTNQGVLNIGSCGLHIVNGAFLTGAKASGWSVDDNLMCLYRLFNDAPARREDFMKISGQSTMPLKFCKHRWLENIPVAERALLIFDSVVKYVKAVQKKKITRPGNKSYETVEKYSKLAVTPARLHFFISVAKIVNPYLTAYQTDAPMLPFLAKDLTRMLANLMQRFLNIETRTKQSAYKLMQVDVDDATHQLPPGKLDIGFNTERSIQSLKTKKLISERMELDFRMEAKAFVISMTRKLVEKCPLKYSLVRSLGCLDPTSMASDKDGCMLKMKRVFTTLSDAKRIEGSCDEILVQYGEACDEAATVPEMLHFDHRNQRVDSALFTFLANKPTFNDLWKVVSMCLLLSHGQASIERAFSINRQMEEDNLEGHSIVNMRAVYDFKFVGGIQNITIDKAMLLASASGRQRYHAFLDEKKREKERAEKDSKRKHLMDKVEELKTKRARLQKDAQSLKDSADKKADKAEATGNIRFISQSNAYRRSAKDKELEITQIDKEIEEQLKVIKNA